MAKDKVPDTTSWVLTDIAFARFLRWLDADQQRAGEKYERLRLKLRLFFEHRGCLTPEDFADKTLDRVIRKLDGGEEIQITDPASYLYGVAHNILKEYWREPTREVISLDSQPDNGNPHANVAVPPTTEGELQETELNLGYLDTCLRQLPPEDRKLILSYYEGDHRGRITCRQELAQSLEISPGSLRIRALRIREQLHRCINRCKKSENGK
jgi:RNA polymerase sigma factor (sigma-70 family)